MAKIQTLAAKDGAESMERGNAGNAEDFARLGLAAIERGDYKSALTDFSLAGTFADKASDAQIRRELGIPPAGAA